MNNSAIVIKFKMLYEAEADIVAIAPTMELAKEHAEDLKLDYPDLYPHGEFFFEEYEVIG